MSFNIISLYFFNCQQLKVKIKYGPQVNSHSCPKVKLFKLNAHSSLALTKKISLNKFCAAIELTSGRQQVVHTLFLVEMIDEIF